jgi:sulfofructose kinase
MTARRRRVRPRVVCIGIATLDAIVVVDRLPGSDERVPAQDGILAGGGVAATAAVTLARLGVPVAFVGAVGDDTAGRLIRDGLADEGVDVAGLRLDRGRSPVSAILIEGAGGLRAIAPFLGDGEPIVLDAAAIRACLAADWVHVDDLGIGTLPSLAAAGVTTPVSVDDGVGTSPIPFDRVTLYAPTRAVLSRRFPAATFAAAEEACLAAGPRLVVTTNGAFGSSAAVRDPTDGVIRHSEAGFAVGVRSTLGAGDVFHGALLAGLLDGADVGPALRLANAAAALACRGLDGRSAIPTRPELDAWLADNRAITRPAPTHG